MSDLETLIRQLVRDELAKRDIKPANDTNITVADYARKYSLSQSTVRAAIRDNRLQHIRIGRAVRIPVDAKIGTPARATLSRARAKLLAVK